MIGGTQSIRWRGRSGKVFNSVAGETLMWIKKKEVDGESEYKKPALGLFFAIFLNWQLIFPRNIFTFVLLYGAPISAPMEFLGRFFILMVMDLKCR